MAQACIKLSQTIAPVVIMIALMTSAADADIIIYDTTFGEGAGNVLDKGDNQAVRDDTLWQSASGSGWTHGVGNTWVFNTQTGDGVPPFDGPAAEAPLFKILNLAGKGLTTENALNLSFNYSAWGAAAGTGQDDLYIHVWGLQRRWVYVQHGCCGSCFPGGKLLGRIRWQRI